MEQPSRGEVVVYQAPAGESRVEVMLDHETVWLSQAQMAELFERDRTVIARHINNVFREGELDRESNVQNLHVASGGDRPTAFYNLDVIISVGYRVKSKRGTQFRIWATKTLRDHLVRGFTLNERRLRERGLGDLEQALVLTKQALGTYELAGGDTQALLDVVARYARSWRLLKAYDENSLPADPPNPHSPTVGMDLASARAAIAQLRDQLASDGPVGMFAVERGDALGSILLNIEQTFGGEPLYPSVELRAANLLYLVIKDHPLVDGNKRVASLLFLDYLRRNGALRGTTGELAITDTELVALALLVAESEPRQKDLVIRLIMTLVSGDGQMR
jgi:prophage maintenance system killer protein